MRRLLTLLLLLLPVRAHAVIYTIAAGDATGLRTTIETTASSGDVIEVPGGTYTITTAITISKNLVILGGEGQATTIVVNGAVNGFAVDANAAAGGVIDGLRIAGIRFTGNGTTSLAAIKTLVTSGKSITAMTVERCTAASFITGFDLGGTGMTMRNVVMFDCWATSCRNNGFALTNIAAPILESCYASANNAANSTSATAGAQLLVSSCDGFTVRGLNIVTFSSAAGATKVGLAVVGCRTGSIDGVSLTDATLQTDSYGVRLTSLSKGVNIGSLVYSKIAFPITADATSVYPAVSLRTVVRTDQ